MSLRESFRRSHHSYDANVYWKPKGLPKKKKQLEGVGRFKHFKTVVRGKCEAMGLIKLPYTFLHFGWECVCWCVDVREMCLCVYTLLPQAKTPHPHHILKNRWETKKINGTQQVGESLH